MRISKPTIKYEPRDLWIGLYWDKAVDWAESIDIDMDPFSGNYWNVIRLYFVLIPTIVLKIELHYDMQHD